MTRVHQKALTSLFGRRSKDLLLVGECGGRVKVHSHLLALHSPLAAGLLEDVGGEGCAISLPLPLASLTSLANLLQGRQHVGEEVGAAAHLLGIPSQDRTVDGLKHRVKMENNSSGEDDAGNSSWLGGDGTFWGEKEEIGKMESDDAMEEKADVKHQSHAPSKLTKRKPKKKLAAKKFSDTSSDSDSDEDDNDPDFGEVKEKKNGSTSKTTSKKRRKSPTWKPESTKGEFECDLCNLSFKKPGFLMRHKLQKHEIPIVCEVCSKEFTLLADFNMHMKESHPIHTCDICGIKKNTSLQLSTHIESKHKEDIPCPHCGVMFSTKDSLGVHLYRFHSDREVQKCTECDYSTKVEAEMRKHFKSRHTDECLETCEFCGEVFKKLKGHLLRTGCGQTNVQPKPKIPCPQCDKTFSSKQDMNVHIKRIHLGVKDKMCSHCSYATYSNHNLKLHITKVHLGTGMVKEPCPHCDKETTNLEYHIKTYHGSKIITSPEKNLV